MVYETLTRILNKSRNKICKYPTITYKEITNVPRLTAKGNEQTQFKSKVCGISMNLVGLSVISDSNFRKYAA